MSLYNDYLDDKDEEHKHSEGREAVKRAKEYEDYLRRTNPAAYDKYVYERNRSQCHY